jgi:hypothetical protein
MRIVVFGLLLSATTMGCTVGLNLQRASARAIIPTPYPDSVVVTEVHAGISMTRWVATTSTGVYDCSREGDERVPICAKRGTP